MSKKRKPRQKTKAQNNINRALRGMKGMYFTWVDEDPLADGEAFAQVGHKNPMFRIMAAQVAADFEGWIKNTQPFRWLITIEAVCNDGKDTYVKPVELEALCKYSDLGPASEEQIEKLFGRLNMKHYQHMAFRAEIVGY